MTIEEKKIEIISKVVDLDDDKLIDAVNALLKDRHEQPSPKAGWGKKMINHIASDFDDFIPPGFDQ